jgi:hypothetical protein
MSAAAQPGLLARLLKDGPDPEGSDEPKGLLADQRGATMVMGVFMAAMLVGMIYYVWGIGGAVVHRERLQDAADTAAFGAAVIEARGMNLIALLNTIMLVLAIIGTAWQIVPYIIFFAATFATAECLELLEACCWYSGCCIYACESAIEHWIDFADSLDTADDWDSRISNAISMMNRAANAVDVGAPAMAQALVIAYGTDVYRPTTDWGAADIIPLVDTLEAEDDDSDWVCGNDAWIPGLDDGELGDTPSIFGFGTAAASVIFAAMSTRTTSWFWEGTIPGLELGWLMEQDEYCDGDPNSFIRVPEESWLGEEEFQVRTLMHGEPMFAWTTQGVAVANWGRMEGTDSYLAMIPPDVANSTAFAQAEYYWEHTEGDVKQEWVFSPRWRARMRRFSLSSAAGSLPLIGPVLSTIDGFIIH